MPTPSVIPAGTGSQTTPQFIPLDGTTNTAGDSNVAGNFNLAGEGRIEGLLKLALGAFSLAPIALKQSAAPTAVATEAFFYSKTDGAHAQPYAMGGDGVEHNLSLPSMTLAVGAGTALFGAVSLLAGSNVMLVEDATAKTITMGLNSSVLINPMTTVNDMIVGGASGAPTRLATVASKALVTDGSGNVLWGDLPIGAGSTGLHTGAGTDLTGSVNLVAGTNVTITESVPGNSFTFSLGSSVVINPMTTTGDLIIGGASGTPTRLAKSTDGKVLTLVSGSPAWATDIGFANPMIAVGDLIIGGASGVATRLAASTDGKVLTLVSGSPAWANPAFTNPMTTSNDLIVGGAAGVPTRLATVGSKYFQTDSSGVPFWGDAPGAPSAFFWTTKTANYTITTADSGIAVDATASNVTITLPTAVGATQQYAIKKVDGGSNTVTVVASGGQTVDGLSAQTLHVLAAEITVGSDGTNWQIETGFTPNPATTEGDLIYLHNAILARLALGANGAFLASDGTDPTYRALLASDLPLATASAFGAVKPDNTTVTVSAGVISVPASAGAARLAIQSGSVAPPVQLWNSDGTDFVYLSVGTP